MDDQKLIAMWKMGWGSMNDALLGRSKPAGPQRRAIKTDWKLHRMPRTRSHFGLDLPLTNDEFETLAWGHIPEEMEDHWFMYFDGEAFCFHRSWTGFCIYRVYVRRDQEAGGYVLHRATVNRKKEQYGEVSDERDAIMVAILVGQALGRDVSALWELWIKKA